MKEIPLTGGGVAQVDDEDYPLISRFAWQYGMVDMAPFVLTNISSFTKHVNLLMHQMIMPSDNGKYIHHIDGDVLNNQKSNLVPVSNNFRRHLSKKHRNGMSEYKGVSFNKKSKKWYGIITFEKKHMTIYSGDSEIDAARAYNVKAKELYGDLAYQNKID